MSRPAGGPEPSLIQQRMALERRRNWGIYAIVFSSVMTVGWTVAFLLDAPAGLWRVLSIIVFAAGIVVGIVETHRARRALREFVDRHGPGAGVRH
ncbi:hypothetical protein AB1285_09920 [Microbacterium sp. NRRL B-14842]|uniref:hypothetical protein n=1 Tax=Microbacterium sp. NRRL B-14842 TaxID=3162881 RepID=UPI0035192AFE